MGDFFAPFLLVAALALDAFVAALGYGAASIRIPTGSLLVIALICSGALSAALLAGGLLAPLLPPAATRLFGCGLLALLGAAKLIEEPLKRRRAPPACPPAGRAFSPGALLSIYCRPDCADRDCSRTLSPGEACALALALSLDGAAAGIGAGAVCLVPLSVLLISIAVHLAGIRLGEAIGRRLARTVPVPLAPLCGAMLILLALLQFYG